MLPDTTLCFLLLHTYVNSENICDFSGFQQAYLAYQHNKDEDDDVLLPGLTELSPEKLFFVQYAQVWCEISGKEGYRKALLDSHAPGRCLDDVQTKASIQLNGLSNLFSAFT